MSSLGSQPLGSFASPAPKYLAEKLKSAYLRRTSIWNALYLAGSNFSSLEWSSAAAVHCTAGAIGHLHIRHVLLLEISNACSNPGTEMFESVVALDQPSAGRIVVRGGQRQPGVIRSAEIRSEPSPSPGNVGSHPESSRDHDPAALTDVTISAADAV